MGPAYRRRRRAYGREHSRPLGAEVRRSHSVRRPDARHGNREARGQGADHQGAAAGDLQSGAQSCGGHRSAANRKGVLAEERRPAEGRLAEGAVVEEGQRGAGHTVRQHGRQRSGHHISVG